MERPAAGLITGNASMVRFLFLYTEMFYPFGWKKTRVRVWRGGARIRF